MCLRLGNVFHLYRENTNTLRMLVFAVFIGFADYKKMKISIFYWECDKKYPLHPRIVYMYADTGRQRQIKCQENLTFLWRNGFPSSFTPKNKTTSTCLTGGPGIAPGNPPGICPNTRLSFSPAEGEAMEEKGENSKHNSQTSLHQSQHLDKQLSGNLPCVYSRHTSAGGQAEWLSPSAFYIFPENNQACASTSCCQVTMPIKHKKHLLLPDWWRQVRV